MDSDSHTYHLPESNTAPELARLTEQAAALHDLMHGNIFFHAPLDATPKRILDVGCGTGVTCLELAQKYPSAEVYGVDLSCAFTAISNSGPLPENLHFIQGDIWKLIEAKQAPFNPGGFDFVFSRLLILGVADWPAHIAVLSNLAAPNGYIELHEVDMDFYSPSSPTDPLPVSFQKALKQDFAVSGLDYNAGRNLSECMKATPGLADVETQYYRSLCIPEGASKAERRMAEYMNKIYVSFIGMMIETLGTKAGRNEEERKILKEGLSAEHERFEPGTHVRFWVSWTRKE